MKQMNLIYSLKNGELVHISQVESGLKCGCCCPSCGAALIARKGKKMMHHFAHYHADECEHGYESSLHMAAKNIISEAKEIWIPQVDILFDSYKSKILLHEATLIQVDDVRLEKRMGDIIPDVVIKSNGKEFIIEIYVTHAIDNEKLIKIKKRNISTLEIDLSKQETAIDENFLKDVLIGETAQKQWKYNAVAEMWRQKFINSGQTKEIIARGFALHVDNCPIESRIWKGKPYANVIDDCLSCQFCIDGSPHDKILCSGSQFIAELEDFKLSFETRKKKYISESEAQKIDSIANNRCPNCGGSLILRKSSYGEFRGCSNYPHCRFTLSIDPETGELKTKA